MIRSQASFHFLVIRARPCGGPGGLTGRQTSSLRDAQNHLRKVVEEKVSNLFLTTQTPSVLKAFTVSVKKNTLGADDNADPHEWCFFPPRLFRVLSFVSFPWGKQRAE